jgi:hypothetical protein
MARESQGLQIALIVFVMFTIILGVTTFMFSKEYSKAKALAADAEAKATEANGALSATESENMRLKQVVGHAETATLPDVDDEFAKDMLTFAQNYNEANRSYRSVCGWLFQEVQRKNAALSAEKDRVKQVNDDKKAMEGAKDKQIEQFSALAKKAAADLLSEQEKFRQAQELLKNTHGTLQKTHDDVVKASHVAKLQSEAQVAAKVKEIEKLESVIGGLYVKIDEMDPVVVDHPDGIITYAGRGDRVSINLGRADGLSLLTNFSVYARDMTDVTTAGRKGAIEVIRLDGDHRAEAKIVDEDVSNPMLAGDKIFTPLWKPGEREHFALTCGMDLNDDNRSDVDELRNLITSNGGVVDFWLDDTGQKSGTITANTKYLVEGKKPTDGSSTERLTARTWIVDEAKRFNLRTISMEELLNRMGYKRKVHVVRYDTKADPNDFRAQPPEGVPRVSPGRVSDKFEKRNPPRPAVNSAY